MTVTLCVLLWANADHETELIAYEDRVLQLLPDYGGQILQRARGSGTPDEPLEVHLLWFPSEDALDGFMRDERRVAMSQERENAIARTQVLRVDLV